jgi:hypothetical protein
MAPLRAPAWALCLALCLSGAAAQQYSALLPAWRCARQDAACAALGDLYAATGGAQWRNNTGGWTQAAAGTPVEYCDFAHVTCTQGNVTAMCAREAAPACERARVSHASTLTLQRPRAPAASSSGSA